MRMSNEELEQFVRLWQTSASVNDVADAMGISKLGASVKASHLRRRGVPLKKHRTGIGSDPTEFIAIWNDSATLEEAADRLGILKTSASMRASHLRKLGMQVKRFPRGRRGKQDTSALADLALSLLHQQD